MDRLVLVANTHRIAPGLLSFPAWVEMKKGPVLTSTPDHPQLPYLDAAGIEVDVLPADEGTTALAIAFRERARGGQAVWLAGPGGDPDFARSLGLLAAREGGVELEVVYGSYDLPGAKLLDLVTTMDRLRSPGGCPWDAQQTHETLAHYLVEETYEALDAIERGDLDALRDELGDVLLQVVFHARVAEERGENGWTIDDVAAGIVAKLVRRHPHVFGDVTVADADEVVSNWDDIKRSEREARGDDADPLAHVPLGQPALTLAATLQRKAAKAGREVEVPRLAEAVTDAQALHAAAASGEPAMPDEPARVVGDLLFAAVALARELDVDPEAALRARARAFRESVTPREPGSESDLGDGGIPDDDDVSA